MLHTTVLKLHYEINVVKW